MNNRIAIVSKAFFITLIFNVKHSFQGPDHFINALQIVIPLPCQKIILCLTSRSVDYPFHGKLLTWNIDPIKTIVTMHQKLRSLILILFFFLLFSPAFSQSKHYDYSSAEKRSVYKEDFGPSSDYWYTDEPGRRSAKIENGDLIFRSLNDQTQVKYKTIDLDWEQDWELEFKVKWIRGKETSAIDFIWDKEPGNSNKYHFGFTAGRKYVLAEYKDGEYDHILKFISSTIVNKTNYNTFTVRKVGRTYYFFINAQFIKSMPYKPIKGDFIGFTVPPKTTISVDHLYAFQLEKAPSISTITSVNTSNKKSYNNYSQSDMTRVYREDFNEPKTKWEVFRSGERMGKTHDGVLDWISMNDNAQSIWDELDVMDWKRDWQVEIRMKHVTGKPNSSNDLLLDIQQNNEKYHFGFTAEGKYVLSQLVGKKYESIVPFTASSIVNKDLFNKFTIRKVGSQYQFFVNEDLITTKTGISVTSNKVGFMVPPNSTLQIDYLDVSYLNSNKTIASLNAQTAGYTTVMTKYSEYTTQRWKTRDEFPKEEIASDWDDGYSVTDLSYDNDKWSLIMSKGSGYTIQKWRTRYEFPKDEIKEMWDEDYKITELNYGNGVWAVVMSKGSGYGKQRWATTADFPSEKIKEFADEGLSITELTYGDDRWALVGSRTSSYAGQRWFKTVDYPQEEIDREAQNGYIITQLEYHNNFWVLIMSKVSGRTQVLFNNSTFPKEEIRKYWNDGYHITDITYSEPQESVFPSTTNTSNPNNNISELLVGKWYGGGINDPDTEKGYMIFDTDKFTTMITKGDTIGGKGFVTDGVPLDLKYEVVPSTSPQGINLVFYSAGENLGNMKGIIRMIDEDTFEFCLADELTDPRPTAFKDSGSVKLAVFKRIN